MRTRTKNARARTQTTTHAWNIKAKMRSKTAQTDKLIKVRAAQGQKSRGKKFGLKPIFFPNFKKNT